MLSVSVEFLHRTVRASGPDDTAITGADARSFEWPPSPMRLYSAFVAADGTGERSVAAGSNLGLDALEGEPVIFAETVCDLHADPSATDGVLVNAVQPRFVVHDQRDKGGAVQEYPARRSVVVRPGSRLSLREPRVVYTWPEATPTEQELRCLRLRAARIGYLGCADSPVRVRVATEEPDVGTLPAWEPDTEGTAQISHAYPGVLEHLDAAYHAWTGGKPRKRSWVPPRLARYRPPGTAVDAVPRPAMVWLRFDRAVAGRFVVGVADAARSAVLGRVEALVGSADSVPSVLHGHGVDRGSEHVRWLPLPHVGPPHADGRIRGLCIWLPPGTDPDITTMVRQAAAGVRELKAPRLEASGGDRAAFATGVSVFDGSPRPWTSNPRRWMRPATRFVTAFPAIHERYSKRPLSLADVAQWCAYAGLPEPVAFRSAKVPLVPGGVAVPPMFTRRKGEQIRPHSHVAVTFGEPVSGPVAFGRGRHWGLGLLVPLDDEAGHDGDR